MRKVLAAATAAMVALSPVASEAACSVSDIAGTWRFMATGASTSDGHRIDGFLVADCRMAFGTTGRLTAMTCFPDRNVDMVALTDRSLQWTTFSTAQVGRNCWVKVNLETYMGDQDNIWLDGHMTRNKDMIAGYGKAYENSGVFQFSMVRHSQ
jgi:hypothetical protein